VKKKHHGDATDEEAVLQLSHVRYLVKQLP